MFVFVLFCVLVLRWYCIGLWYRVDVRAMRYVCMYEGRTCLPRRLDKLSMFFFLDKTPCNYDTDYKSFWAIQTMSYSVLSVEWFRTNGSLPYSTWAAVDRVVYIHDSIR